MILIIDSGYAVGAILFSNFKVYNTPPIFSYMFGWSLETVLGYCDKKGWEVSFEDN